MRPVRDERDGSGVPRLFIQDDKWGSGSGVKYHDRIGVGETSDVDMKHSNA